MKTISAEDKKTVIGVERYRFYGTLLIVVSFLIGSFGSMMLSGFSLLDNSPTSYIIVVMMMDILFVFFTLKDRRSITAGKDSMLIGLAVFAAYVLILAVLRVSLSWIFLTYRIDALLLPLLLLSLVIAVFGIDGIKVFWPAVAYVALASPIILLPVLGLNGLLAKGSAQIVYTIVKVLGVSVSLSGLAITAPTGASVTIAETCVPIGTFVALVMFLVPVAYLYNGKFIRKAVWVFSGVLLLFALNIARMSVISFAWAHYGMEGAISGFHSVAGGIIFYAAIAVMLLLCGRYGMGLSSQRLPKTKHTRSKHAYSAVSSEVLILCMMMGIVALVLSIPYSGSMVANPISFGSTHATTGVMNAWIESILGGTNAHVTYLGSFNNSSMFGISGVNASSGATYALVGTSNYPDAGINMLNFSSVSKYTEIYRSGITIHSVLAQSNQSRFDVEYFSIPYPGNFSETVNVELFSKLSSSPGLCAVYTNSIASYVDRFESLAYNILSGGSLSDARFCNINLPL